jgi:hypothetical protein
MTNEEVAVPTNNELRKRYGDEAYFGRSKRAPMRPPSLKRAVKDAYDQAAATGGGAATGEKVYRVVDIWAVGTNPLSEYIVVLGQDS